MTTSIRIAVLLLALMACVIDVRERRIPNWLTFTAALLGMASQLLFVGPWGLLVGTAGLCVGLIVFFVPFALGGMGAGDVKLVAALGVWLGPAGVLWLCVYTAIAGAVLAIIVSLARGYLRQALRNLWLLLMHWRVMGLRPLAEMTIYDAKGPKLAYGVAILAGTMVTVWTR